MIVIWSDPALNDLRGIHANITASAPWNADRFVEALVDAVDVLQTMPAIGPLVPDSKSPDIRELTHQGYRIIYRLGADRVVILAVIHGSRDLSRMSRKPWETP